MINLGLSKSKGFSFDIERLLVISRGVRQGDYLVEGIFKYLTFLL